MYQNEVDNLNLNRHWSSEFGWKQRLRLPSGATYEHRAISYMKTHYMQTDSRIVTVGEQRGSPEKARTTTHRDAHHRLAELCDKIRAA